MIQDINTLKKKKAKALRTKHRRMVSDEAISLLEWTLRYRKRIDENTFFTLNDHLYLVGIYEAFGNAKKIVIKKGSQIGVSEYLVSLALYSNDVRNADVFYMMPTVADYRDFSTMRFDPALNSSPYLKSLVTQHGSESTDRMDLKKVAGQWLVFRSATVKPDNSARQLLSVPADILVGDEVDKMHSQALTIARYRLGHSDIAEEVLASTPTAPGVGIDAEWEESDQREWFLKCSGCNKWQFPTIDHIISEVDDLNRPVEWYGRKEGRAYIACSKCHKEIDRLGYGEWVARFPNREVMGFHPTRLIASHCNLLSVVEMLRELDEAKIRECMNQQLGETFVPKGGRLDDTELDACRREYAHGTPSSGVTTCAGIDVGSALNMVIRERVRDGNERKQLFCAEVYWDDISYLLDRFNVKTCVIDGEPEVTKAREFQKEHARGRVWLADYPPSGLDTKKNMFWDHKKGIVKMDRTRTLDAMFGKIRMQEWLLPANIRNIDNYYKHMKALIKISRVNRNGETVLAYVHKDPDHYAHAENYCYAASQRSGSWGG